MKTTCVENITAFISNMRPSKQEEQGPVGPVPVATIDGVDYYHKCEFDLENLQFDYSQTLYDVLTAEIIENGYPNIRTVLAGSVVAKSVRFYLYSTIEQGPQGFILSDIYGGANFTSRAFTVVDTQEEVTDNTKICLPTCSAYYGFLSEDDKTFISYYNLKGE